MSADYKSKFKEMRAKLLESTDMAYRLGFEDGLKQAATENAQMQVQQMQQQMAGMQGQQIDPATGQPIQDPNQQIDPATGQPMQQDPNAMGGQPPMGPDGMPMQDPSMMQGQPMEEEGGPQTELDGYINELEELVSKGQKPTVTDLRKAVTALADLRKSQKMRMKINKPKEISAQKSMVDNILKKWEKESKLTADNLEDKIRTEGLKL